MFFTCLISKCKLLEGRDHILLVHSNTLCARACGSLAQNKCQIKYTNIYWATREGQREETARCWGPRVYIIQRLCSGWENGLVYHLKSVLFFFPTKEPLMEENSVRLSASPCLCSFHLSAFHHCDGLCAVTSTSLSPPSVVSFALQGSQKLHFPEPPLLSGSKSVWPKEKHFQGMEEAEKGEATLPWRPSRQKCAQAHRHGHRSSFQDLSQVTCFGVVNSLDSWWQFLETHCVGAAGWGDRSFLGASRFSQAPGPAPKIRPGRYCRCTFPHLPFWRSVEASDSPHWNPLCLHHQVVVFLTEPK